MNIENQTYHKGDVFIANLGSTFGHEQHGIRPVIILQNDVGNIFSPTVSICPLTSKDKKPDQLAHYRLNAEKYDFLKESSTVLCEAPRTLDKRLLSKYLGQIDKADLTGVDDALAAHFGYYIPDGIEAP